MKLTTVVWWCCWVRCVVTDILFCSEYLVSGINGVKDSALTASSVYDDVTNGFDCSPRNARLFYPGVNYKKPLILGAWHSGAKTRQQYIQVTFPVDTVINAVTLQGSWNADQWVSSYYLLYSIDGRTWTGVTSSDGSPKLFVGSHDRSTPMTAEVTPNITARYLRINPYTWHVSIALRFDVGGCQPRNKNDGSDKSLRKSAVLTEEMMGSQLVSISISNVSSLKDCALRCYSQSTYKSYTYQTVAGIQRCTCYKNWVSTPGCATAEEGIFVNPDILVMYGYIENHEPDMLYKIIEVRRNQKDASTTCTRQYTQLMRVNTPSKLIILNNIIKQYRVLKNNFRFYVSGAYSSNVWRYSGGTDVLERSLWSPNNPDPAKGHCVMMTLTGLQSVDCQINLFSICGI